MNRQNAAQTVALTAIAMIAFAANSVIGRLGLLGGDIGAGSFAAIRLLSGAIVLAVLVKPKLSASGDWKSGLALFVYAAFFSYAYITLPAGTGALILFALVQITMLGAGLAQGERLSFLQWGGALAAVGALIWLLSPGIKAPALAGSTAMAIAGIAWGAYSLFGRGTGDPANNTAGNFIRASLIAAVCLPFALLVSPEPSPGITGIGLAVVSGAFTSGLGYVIWYAALNGLTATRAGIAQLTVPAIAALGGVLFLMEPITARFFWSSAIILAGVGIATLTRTKCAA